MELQKHFVAFIDILGFTKYVMDNALSPDKPLEFLKKFIDIPKKFQKPIQNLKVTIFSDNIIASMLTKENSQPPDYELKIWDFITYVNYLQLYITTSLRILPIRGGVTYGDFYHDGSDLLFGEAMIEAYDLERLHAFFPRIVVKSKFLDPIKYLSAHERFSSIESSLVKFPNYEPDKLLRHYPVKYDFDGVLFCNYLSALYLATSNMWSRYSEDALNKHKEFILENLQNSEDLNVSRKYIWMKNYHNWFCEPYEEFQKFIIPDEIIIRGNTND